MQVLRIAVLYAALLGVCALRINRIEAPEHAFIGDTVTLRCDYDLDGGGNLSSVKWYHDNVQFYMYRAEDGSWAFPKKDMTIDLRTSDESHVTLKNVSTSLSGKYKCEVSLGAPLFTTDMATHHLTISRGNSVKNLKLVLPQDLKAGDPTAVLECKYEVDSVHIDSVKWYKDSAEFYSFQPGHPPIKESKPLPGIHVDVLRSNGNHVVIYNINVDTAGNYRCQVTTDTQPPQSFSADGKLTILNPRIPELEIPTVFLQGDVHIGERLTILQCNYNLQGEKLHSVKWYKDNHEFYRFTLASSPQQEVFPQQGVHVEKNASDNRQLIITDITNETAGMYHCEVQTDAPSLLNLKAKPVLLDLQDPVASRTLQNPIILLPDNVHVGNKAITLQCFYDLQGERLHSLKWYKNKNEFYRFLPSNIPEKLVFPLQGINVNITASDDKQVTLTDITKDTADLYKCEISTDAPHFKTLQGEAQLNVLDAERPAEGNFFNRAYNWIRNKWNDIKPK